MPVPITRRSIRYPALAAGLLAVGILIAAGTTPATAQYYPYYGSYPYYAYPYYGAPAAVGAWGGGWGWGWGWHRPFFHRHFFFNHPFLRRHVFFHHRFHHRWW